LSARKSTICSHPEDEVTFYRAIQECVSNVVKHSQAERASVHIKREADGIEAEVADNGRGFARENQAQPDQASGFGLKGISERVRMLGGHFFNSVSAGEGDEDQCQYKERKGEKMRSVPFALANGTNALRRVDSLSIRSRGWY
jgi:signal transduction histidine kinase